MKQFIVEMDEICDMSIDFGGISGRRVCSSKNRYNDCEGDLKNLPSVCPLREVNWYERINRHDYWVEVKNEPKMR